MPLGGFAPCPLPLGGTSLDGLTAEQHARLCADLKASILTAPFAVIRFNTGSASPYAYVAQHGVGELVAPVITLLPGGGDARLTWSASYLDEYDNAYSTSITQAVATPSPTLGLYTVATVEIESARSVRVRTFYSFLGLPFNIDCDVTLVVW